MYFPHTFSRGISHNHFGRPVATVWNDRHPFFQLHFSLPYFTIGILVFFLDTISFLFSFILLFAFQSICFHIPYFVALHRKKGIGAIAELHPGWLLSILRLSILSILHLQTKNKSSSIELYHSGNIYSMLDNENRW